MPKILIWGPRNVHFDKKKHSKWSYCRWSLGPTLRTTVPVGSRLGNLVLFKAVSPAPAQHPLHRVTRDLEWEPWLMSWLPPSTAKGLWQVPQPPEAGA